MEMESAVNPGFVGTGYPGYPGYPDYPNTSQSTSPVMGSGSMYVFGEKSIMAGECDHLTYDQTPYFPCLPWFTPEVDARRINDRLVVKSTAPGGGCRPSPYPAPSAWRDRKVTVTGEDPGPSVKCFRGAMPGENVLDATSELEELIARYAGDVTATGEAPEPSARCSTDENLLENAVRKLGMSMDEMRTCDHIAYKKKLARARPTLSEDEIDLLKKKHDTCRGNQRSRASKARKRVRRDETAKKLEELEEKREELKAKAQELKEEIKILEDLRQEWLKKHGTQVAISA